MIEINGDIWSFGGHSPHGGPMDDVFRLAERNGNGECKFAWTPERKMLSTRSGFSLVQNRFENSVLLIGSTLKGKNKPMERIGFKCCIKSKSYKSFPYLIPKKMDVYFNMVTIKCQTKTKQE